MFHCFLRFGCGDAFCTDTFLQTDGVTHRSLYTEQLLRADILTQRGLCTKKMYTDAFAHRGFYAKKEVFTHRCFVQRCFCAHKCRHIGVFTHRTFSTEKPLHRTIFTYVFVIHKKHLTQRTLYTQTAHRHFYRPTFLHLETLPRTIMNNFYTAETFSHRCLHAQRNMHSSFYRQTVFTHRKFSAQKSYAQKVLHAEGFTHNSFYIQMLSHTNVFTQTQIAHRNLCTQHAFTHSQLLHREALLPLLDHLPFVFPLSNHFLFEQIIKIMTSPMFFF